MDGTFDQLKPIKTLIDFKYNKYFSFDLSAATDRLPVSLQKRILFSFLGLARASA
jgi:hypothetical protein